MATSETNCGVIGFIDPQAQARFETRGYEVVTLFSKSDLSFLSDQYQDPVALQPDAYHPSGFHATMYSLDAEYRNSVYQLLRQFLEDKIQGTLSGYDIRAANWLVKDPTLGDSTVPFHQDWSFVDERQHRTLNLWFPLIDVDEQNGCLEVVPGSHLISTDHRAHTDQCRFDNLAPQLRKGYTTFIPIQAGQAVVYDSALLHCSASNRSGRRRIAVNSLLAPKGVDIIHPHRIAGKQVEVFAVDETFFCRHVPGTRPEGATLLGVAKSSVKQHGPEELKLLARIQRRSKKSIWGRVVNFLGIGG